MTQTLTDHRPDVSNICTDDWEWMEVEKLFHGHSGDYWGESLAHPGNAQQKRSHPDFKKLMKSLKEEGFHRPVLVEFYHGQETLENGHHRVVAAHDLGFTHVPVTRDAEIGWDEDDDE